MPVLSTHRVFNTKSLGKIKLSNFTTRSCSECQDYLENSEYSDKQFVVRFLSDSALDYEVKQSVNTASNKALSELSILYSSDEFGVDISQQHDVFLAFRNQIKKFCNPMRESLVHAYEMKPNFIGSALASYKDLYTNLAAGTASLANLYNVSSSINSLQKTIDLATANNTHSLKTAIRELQELTKKSVWLNLAQAIDVSPLVKETKRITNLNIKVLDKVLVKDKPLRLRVIKTDPLFNIEAYRYLFTLEVTLRKFIQSKIIGIDKTILTTKMFVDLSVEWSDRESEEKSNKYCGQSDYSPIDYSDFPDLKRILDHHRSKTLLKGLLSEEDIKAITSKLFELEPIRKKIAHSRLITSDDLNTIKIYAEKILAVLKKITQA